MLFSLISLLLLVVAVYFLIKTKPNLFLFELMKEAFDERKDSEADYADKSKNEQTCKLNSTEKN
jgi:hypothetical protein